MRVSIAAKLTSRKRGTYRHTLRLYMSRDEAAVHTVDDALDLAIMAYGYANARLVGHQQAAGSVAKLPRYIHVESADTSTMPRGVTAAIADLLGAARAVKPTPELEEVRTLLRAALLQRYAEVGVMPPSASQASLQRRLHEGA